MSSHKRKEPTAAEAAVASMRCDDDEKVVDEAIAEASRKKARVEEEKEYAADATAVDTMMATVEEKRLVVGAGGRALVVVGAPPVDNLFLDEDSPLSIAEQFATTYRAMLPFAKRGQTLVRNPDLAMALASAALNHKLHILELDNPIVQFNVYRKENKYINFARKAPQQRDFAGDTIMGYNFVSAAFAPMYMFKYGSTKETGIEGNRGKVMESKGKKIPIKPGEESYECTMGCEPIHPDMVDENSNNPIALAFMDSLDSVKRFVWAKVWNNKANMLAMRKYLQEMVDAKTLANMPTTPEEALELLTRYKKYREKLVVSESDPSAKSLASNARCYRHPRKESKYTGEPAEDISDYVGPTDMFVNNFRIKKEEDGKQWEEFNLWHEIPVWRWRRPNEVKEGVRYASPWIRIPTENVRLTRDDIIFNVFSLGFYEDSAKDECSFKHGLTGYVWLNTKKELAKLSLYDLEPCNPLVATPMAGYYKGPLGWEGGEPPEVVAEMEAYRAMEAANSAKVKAAVGDVDASDFE